MENVELGRKVVDHLLANPQELYMGAWAMSDFICGTVACLAGHTMLQAGYTLTPQEDFVRPDHTIVDDEAKEARGLLGLSDAEYYWPGVATPEQGHMRGTTIFSGYLTGEEAFYRFKHVVLASEMYNRNSGFEGGGMDDQALRDNGIRG